MPFVSMIMVRSMSQTTERFYLCSANDFVGLLPSDVCFFDVCLHLKKSPSSKNTYKTTCKLLKREIFDDYR